MHREYFLALGLLSVIEHVLQHLSVIFIESMFRDRLVSKDGFAVAICCHVRNGVCVFAICYGLMVDLMGLIWCQTLLEIPSRVKGVL